MTINSALRFRRNGLVRAMAGSLVLASCLGAAGTAMAGPYRVHHRVFHHQILGSDYNAYVGPGPAAPGGWAGSWRFGAGRSGGCDRAYPMHEGFPCGDATGGPVGGMGS